MHAYLIYGQETEARNGKINELLADNKINEFDQLKLESEGKGLGIEKVKVAIRSLQLSPLKSQGRALIIYEAELLTMEAQQALLKTLEEPPGGAIICLATYSMDALLPTVVSRCLTINLGINRTMISEASGPVGILTGEQKTRLLYLDKIEKEQAKSWVSETVRRLHATLVSAPNKQIYAKIIVKLLTAQRQLTANVNHKLVLLQLGVFKSDES